MTIARVIRKGKSQSLDLPSDLRIYNDEVEIVRRGDELVVKDPVAPQPGTETDWTRVFEVMAELGELIGEVPEDPPPEDRPGL